DLLILGADAGAQLFLAAESTREVDGHELLRIDYRDRAAEYQLELGEFSTGALFVDVDLDGDDDLLVPQLLSGAVQLWLNDDGAGFERDEEAAIDDDAFAPAIGLAAADVDL